MLQKLGIALMDEDHAALERLFARLDATPDSGLPELLATIAAELAAHFAREEKAMTEARVPILLAHIELHQQLLQEVGRMRAQIGRAGAEAARHLIGGLLPIMIREHVASADRTSANFLRRPTGKAPDGRKN